MLAWPLNQPSTSVRKRGSTCREQVFGEAGLEYNTLKGAAPSPRAWNATLKKRRAVAHGLGIVHILSKREMSRYRPQRWMPNVLQQAV
ncbi:hypothetical protein HZ326_2541 [Fusarium oxysporum f. sp. albedinis]|nr:hypothetical protein HZ326_2541 [Fusarium oxysporum f. sp. albedinis]